MLKYKDYFEAKKQNAIKLGLCDPIKKASDEAVYVCFAQQGADRKATQFCTWVEDFDPSSTTEYFTDKIYPYQEEIKIPVIRNPLYIHNKKYKQRNKRWLKKKYVSNEVSSPYYNGKPDVSIYDGEGCLKAEESVELENKVKELWYGDWTLIEKFCEENNLELLCESPHGRYVE